MVCLLLLLLLLLCVCVCVRMCVCHHCTLVVGAVSATWLDPCCGECHTSADVKHMEEGAS